jgi:hypothetical protein
MRLPTYLSVGFGSLTDIDVVLYQLDGSHSKSGRQLRLRSLSSKLLPAFAVAVSHTKNPVLDLCDDPLTPHYRPGRFSFFEARKPSVVACFSHM